MFATSKVESATLAGPNTLPLVSLREDIFKVYLINLQTLWAKTTVCL